MIRQTVIDAEDVRALAEFYRAMFGLRYRPGDEPGESGDGEADWLVLLNDDSGRCLAFQQVPHQVPPGWPDGEPSQMMHLDTTVPCVGELNRQRARALELGDTLLLDRTDDEDEPLYVFADPAGHPFCIFVSAGD